MQLSIWIAGVSSIILFFIGIIILISIKINQQFKTKYKEHNNKQNAKSNNSKSKFVDFSSSQKQKKINEKNYLNLSKIIKRNLSRKPGLYSNSSTKRFTSNQLSAFIVATTQKKNFEEKENQVEKEHEEENSTQENEMSGISYKQSIKQISFYKMDQNQSSHIEQSQIQTQIEFDNSHDEKIQIEYQLTQHFDYFFYAIKT